MTEIQTPPRPVAPERTSPGAGSDLFTAARVLAIILGAWLFLSAFLWPHSAAQYTNTWISGLLCVLFAVVSFARPGARYLNTALSIWLFISAFVLPQVSLAGVWNNALVAIGIFVVSLIPAMGVPLNRPGRRQPV
ncbi:MAG: SPW repeat domain-containing protein [Myxococcaceae bacterium]